MGGPEQSFREGISLVELFQTFPDDFAAEQWMEHVRWGDDGPICPRCESRDRVKESPNRKPAAYWCGTCRNRFNIRTGTVLADTKIGYHKWVIAMYLQVSNLKGVSSMKLHRDLNITQKSAWFLSHRLREAMVLLDEPFHGPVEADEPYLGSVEKNKHQDKKLNAGKGAVGNTVEAGIKDHDTGQVRAEILPDAEADTLQAFVQEHTVAWADRYKDERAAYKGLSNHEAVSHSTAEYVREQLHIIGKERFCATLRRGYYGMYHHMSKKHLFRCVDKFAGRHIFRNVDTIDQMAFAARQLLGKRLTYRELIAHQ